MYTEALSETRYVSLGINFVWKYQASDQGEDLIDLIKNKVVKVPKEFFEKFSEQARFGFAISLPFNSINVTIRLEPHTTENQFLMDFNFHGDIPKTEDSQTRINNIESILDNSNKFLKKAEEIMVILIGD